MAGRAGRAGRAGKASMEGRGGRGGRTSRAGRAGRAGRAVTAGRAIRPAGWKPFGRTHAQPNDLRCALGGRGSLKPLCVCVCVTLGERQVTARSAHQKARSPDRMPTQVWRPERAQKAFERLFTGGFRRPPKAQSPGPTPTHVWRPETA